MGLLSHTNITVRENKITTLHNILICGAYYHCKISNDRARFLAVALSLIIFFLSLN